MPKKKETIIIASVTIIISLALVIFFYFFLYPNLSVEKAKEKAFNAQKFSPPGLTSDGKRPQFVVLAFDGSKSNRMWQDTMKFARDMKRDKKPVHFTYFINTSYLLTPKTGEVYQAPGHSKGLSAIGFGGSYRDIENRVRNINQAFLEGHEIGSHTVGHFDGSLWSGQDWFSELSLFSEFLFNVNKYNPNIKSENLIMSKADLVGFRAPELGVNDSLYPVLANMGYRYDCSGVGRRGEWPYKDKNGLWHIALPTIYLGEEQSAVLSMDYSLYHHQTGVQDLLKKGTAEWQKTYDTILSAYMDYFNESYTGNRAPVYMANHFALWNDGLYWEAMKGFAKEVCGRKDVYCSTHAELVDYLDKNFK